MTQDIFYCASNSAYILRDIRVSEGQDQKGEGGGGGGWSNYETQQQENC